MTPGKIAKYSIYGVLIAGYLLYVAYLILNLVENYQHLHPLHLVAVSQEDEPTVASFVPLVSLLKTKTWEPCPS